MKQKLFKSWLMLCLLLVGVGTSRGESYKITFKIGNNDGTSVSTSTTCSSLVSTGDNYLSGNVVTATKVYSSGSEGLKLGTSSDAGTIKMNLSASGKVHATTVIVTAKRYSSSKATKIALNGKTAQDLTSDFAQYSFTINDDIEYLELVSSKGTSGGAYCWINSITVNYTTSGSGGDSGSTPTKYTVTVANDIANGTVTANPTSAAEGATVTLTATPSSGYEFGSWNVTDASSNAITVTDNKFTMPAANVNVYATFNEIPSHTARFSINGSIDENFNCIVKKGEAITFPSDPELDDVKFMGWTKTPNYSNATTAPADLCKSANMGDGDVTYYAVFATAEGSGTAVYRNVTSLTAGKSYVFGAVKATASKTLANNTAIAGINFTATSSWGTYATLTPNTSGEISSNDVTNNNLVWTLQSITDGAYVFKSGNNYLSLGTSTGASTAGVSTTSAYVYLEDASSACANAFLIHPTSTSTNKLLCNTTSNYGYRMYGSSTNATASMCPYIRFYEYDPGVTYSDYCTIVVVREISSIEVKTAPTTTYCEGEKFNPAGLEITVNYTEGDPEDIAYAGNESKFSFSPALDAELTNADNQVTITYKGMTCQQTINVRTVSISAPTTTEGTYTVKVGDAEAVTADGSTINALKGQKIVLASTPATGYKIASTAFVVTDEDENEVSVSTAGGQYSFTMPGKNVTIAAKFTQVFTVTAGSCEHGSITAIKDASGNVLTETSKGSTVKVEATADTHYHLTGMYYVKEGDDEHNEISENEGVYSFTMPQSNVTVYATFADDTHYNISWMVNGREAKHEEVFADVPVSAPAVDPIDGKVFRGWVAEEINEATNDEPSYVNVFNLTVTEDKMFYAVFATMEGTPETWEEITSAPEEGIYAICSDSYFMKAEVSSNRFANGSTTPQISDGKLTTAPTEDCIWEISKPDTYYRIKNGSNYAGGTSSKNQGALLNDASADLAKWSISYVTDKFEVINYGRSQASSDNSNKYLRNNTSNGWATYASGTGSAPRFFMKHGGATYSEYTTAPLGIGTISISSVGYTTYFTDKEFTMPKGLEGYVVTPKNSTNITLTKAFEGGETVPASTALLVKGEAGDHDYNITNTGATFVGENCLHGNLEAGTVAEVLGATKYYKLLNGKKGLGWYLGAENGGVFEIGANKAYLALTEAQVAGVKSFVLDFGGEDADAINGIDADETNSTIYNLAGQRVQKTQKGIFIVNGKKVMY